MARKATRIVNIRMNDRRLIEDDLPIYAISAEASGEKPARKGHLSMLHLWWSHAGRRFMGHSCRPAAGGEEPAKLEKRQGAKWVVPRTTHATENVRDASGERRKPRSATDETQIEHG
jgi:hypothetical protein